MNEGRIEQVGTPQDLYLRPETRFVADFVGVSNLLETAWIRKNAPALLAGRPAGPDDDFELCVRPENIVLEAGGEAPASLVSTTFLGNLRRFRVHWDGRRLLADWPARAVFADWTSYLLGKRQS